MRFLYSVLLLSQAVGFNAGAMEDEYNLVVPSSKDVARVCDHQYGLVFTAQWNDYHTEAETLPSGGSPGKKEMGSGPSSLGEAVHLPITEGSWNAVRRVLSAVGIPTGRGPSKDLYRGLSSFRGEDNDSIPPISRRGSFDSDLNGSFDSSSVPGILDTSFDSLIDPSDLDGTVRSSGESDDTCCGAGWGIVVAHKKGIVPKGSPGDSRGTGLELDFLARRHSEVDDSTITNTADINHCNCSREDNPYREHCNHPTCDRSSDSPILPGSIINEQEVTFDVKKVASPTDRCQLKYQKNTSAPSVDDFALDAEVAAHPWPTLSVAEEPLPNFSEAQLLRVFQDNAHLESLYWNGILIGPEISRLMKELLERISYFSSQVCGGIKSSTKNIAAWQFILIDKKGSVRSFNPSGIEDLLFVSGEANKRCDESEEPVSCITSGFSGKGPLVGAKVMHRLNTLESHVLEPIAGKRIAVSAMPVDSKAKISVGGPTVAFSDCDVPSGPDKDRRFDHIRDFTKKGIDIAFSKFPQTSIGILREFSNSPQAHEETQPVDTKDILFSKLSDQIIAQIFAHTEQAMARVFEDVVIPRLAAHHAAVSKEDKESGIQGMIVFVASLHDCCWWCQKILTGLSGSKKFSGFEAPINIRFVVAGGKSFASLYCATPGSVLEKADSRAHITEVRKINLAEMPAVFHYGTLPNSVSQAGSSKK